MFQHRCSITMLMLSAAVALGLQRTGWLDRVVQYQKEKLYNELAELAPIKITAEIQPKPEGYVDSIHWDYDSVSRLLTLIRESETAKPVYKSLRRMLRPTRRFQMSIKQSKMHFPSIKKDDNDFYYDGYDSSKENKIPAPPPVPEDQVVLIVSNPVEARLPSARISVKLLREILEARASAARQMDTTTKNPPWLDFIRNRTNSPDGAATTTGGSPTEPIIEDFKHNYEDPNGPTTITPADGGDGGGGGGDGDKDGAATTVQASDGDATTAAAEDGGDAEPDQEEPEPEEP